MANQILLYAADLIETKGWVRGHYFYAGKYCMLGAIGRVGFNSKGYGRLLNCIDEHLGMTAVEYNDTVAKSGKEVVSKLRELAEVC
jgi:hypothetical protein